MLNAMTLVVAGLLLSAGWGAGARAQTCTGEQVVAVVDQTGARLRQINAENQPRLRAKLREVAQKNGWSDADLETKGIALLDDVETQTLDGQAAQLLTKLDQLGDEGRQQGPACQRLDEAKIASGQLIEVTNARSTHVLARLDAAMRPAAAAPPPPPIAAPASPPVVAPPPPQAMAKADPKSAPPVRPARPPASSWGAETVREQPPPPETAPPPVVQMPRPIDPGDLGFSPDDIRAAGRGAFGTISAELAGVIDYAFTQFGRPSGYIVGKEGGGAFLAGLRYGEGMLVTKLGGEHKLYWQGPTVGYDFGLAGSQTMILVYGVKSPEDLLTRFAGVDGSAYLVGGVGVTVLKKGPIVLAPIRTGLGLRVGANIGYLKFTREQSLNPF